MTKAPDKKAALSQLGIEETTTELTGTDVYMSLVRFERLAVVKWFDASVEWLMEHHGEMEGTAALVFVHMCREGTNHRQAYQTVAAMTNREILAYFAAEDSEDLAETPAGKGGSSETSSSTSSPTTEPDSA